MISSSALQEYPFTADEVSAVLRRAFPVPDESFARANWMGAAYAACSFLADIYRTEEAKLTAYIRAADLTSNTFRLREVTRPYARVNLPLLKIKEPELFREIVHVKQSFAEKVLGRHNLYQMVAETIGDDIKNHQVVTVSDVRRLLPASRAALFVDDGEEFVKYEVVKI